MNLPVSFFDVKMTGDIMQRINDHHRIERILTTSSLNVLFSVINILIMGAVLAFYNLQIFAVFFIGGLLYLLWVIIFLRKEKKLTISAFQKLAKSKVKS